MTTTETSRQEEATTTPETTKQEEVTTIPETTGGDESTSVTPADSFGYAPSADHTTITINRYNGKSANVVIPDTINGMKVVKIATQSFQESDDSAVRIKSVVISEGVKEIERLAFANCKYLEKLTIKGNSLVTIGNQAFDRCSSLKTVHLPESVKIIGEYAFASCDTLKNIIGAKGSYAEKFASENVYVFLEK